MTNMRLEDIRFKAKSLRTGKWIDGDLLHRITDTCIAVKDMDDIVYYPVDPSTVCQYTGMKDSKGNELWEHDLIHFIGFKSTAEIRWVKHVCGFMVEHDDELDWIQVVLELGKIERICSKFDKEVDK